MRRSLTVVLLLPLLACDPDQLECFIDTGADPLQHQPCDPHGDDCADGSCVLQSAPGIVWGCEMLDATQGPGHECARHDQCTSGVCIPADLSPISEYAADAVCGFPCQLNEDCPQDSWCHPVGGEGSGFSVCVVPL